MKIVQVNCVPNGSTGHIASNIHSKLLELGYESYFAYGLGQCDLKNTYKISNWFDNHVHVYLSRYTGFHGCFSIFATLKFLKYLKKIKPDLVHLHNIHGYYINVPILFNYLKKHNIKTMWTFHDCWPFTGKCTHYTVVGCDKWKTECTNCPQRRQYPSSYWFDTSKIHYKYKKKLFTSLQDLTITTVSEWLKNQVEMSYLSKYPVVRIYNGIDTSKFKKCDSYEDIHKKYNISAEDKIILGVASSWNERKGLKTFLEISKRFNQDEKIILVGLNDLQIESLPNNIIGIKRTENFQELAKLYGRADAFFSPSLEETFGLVTAEALACGTPVVVINSTACAEIVSDEVGIVLDDVNNIDMIINSFRNIFSKNYDFDKCQKHIKDNYTKEKMIENYINEYKNTLKINNTEQEKWN